MTGSYEVKHSPSQTDTSKQEKNLSIVTAAVNSNFDILSIETKFIQSN